MQTVDLFCGGGGLSQGLLNAGFKIRGAFDWWDAALDFYNLNHKDEHAEKADLSDVDNMVARLKEMRKLDVIAGGPPCQDFSSAGKRDENGGRANLTLSFANIVAGVRPRVFIMENVARAATTKTFAAAMEIFRSCGYGITEAILDASLCGAPQIRKRVFVVGVLGGKDNALLPIYEARQAKQPMTVREYFGDDLNFEHYYRHPRSYARRAIFSVDEPSPTIRGVNRPIPAGYPGHPGDSSKVFPGLRPLTTRERAMVQTFPKEWELRGSKSDLEQIVGNAVPVKLAEFVGSCVKEYLSKQEHYDAQAKKDTPTLF